MPLLAGVVVRGVGIMVCGVVAVVDQVTKNLAVQDLSNRSVHLIGPLSLTLEFNPGFAFSIGTSYSSEITVVATLAVVALVVGSVLAKDLAVRIALGLLAGGALGNVLDRVFRPYDGAVVDFIHTGFWPTFNLADSAIVIGALLLGVHSVRRYRRG